VALLAEAALRSAATSAWAAASLGAASAGAGAAAPLAPRALPTFLPCSAEIVGPRLAVWGGPPGATVCRTCAGCAHAHFECPSRYLARFGAPCPGFDAAGNRVAAAWVNGDLTQTTCAAWKAYAVRFGLRKTSAVAAAPAF
jgi:hypothetical protein